jgi:hypothetical protein
MDRQDEYFWFVGYPQSTCCLLCSIPFSICNVVDTLFNLRILNFWKRRRNYYCEIWSADYFQNLIICIGVQVTKCIEYFRAEARGVANSSISYMLYGLFLLLQNYKKLTLGCVKFFERRHQPDFSKESETNYLNCQNSCKYLSHGNSMVFCKVYSAILR